MNLWWTESGELVACLDDESHALLATECELRNEGSFDGDTHWTVLNNDDDDEVACFED